MQEVVHVPLHLKGKPLSNGLVPTYIPPCDEISNPLRKI